MYQISACKIAKSINPEQSALHFFFVCSVFFFISGRGGGGLAALLESISVYIEIEEKKVKTSPGP